MVWVGPLLWASAPSPGSATPTWLPSTPSIIPREPPMPIRLQGAGERNRAANIGAVLDDYGVVQSGCAGNDAGPPYVAA